MSDEHKVREYGMMFLNVVTPLHNGSGEGLGIIDNPILRERTTQFPLIQASSIKGVLRDAYEEKIQSGSISEADVFSFFGPAPKNGHEHAGAISFGDGHILAFPVRSVKGCFVWVTSPLALWRFYSKISLIGLINSFTTLGKIIDMIKSPLSSAVICPLGKSEICISSNNQKIYLEEYPLPFSENNDFGSFADEVSKFIYSKDVNCFLKNEFKRKLILLDNETFAYFVTNATEIIPNIRIGDNGTTEKGSLRYTEFLPTETVMYSTLVFEKSRSQKSSLKNAAEIKTKFEDNSNFPQNIQIGGDETTGKGIVELSLIKEVSSASGNSKGVKNNVEIKGENNAS